MGTRGGWEFGVQGAVAWIGLYESVYLIAVIPTFFFCILLS